MSVLSVESVNRQALQQEIASSRVPLLIDFWAPWCGPCQMVVPIIDEIAGERDDVVVGKVNVDEERELARQFRVMSIPTLVVLKDGKVVKQSVGAKSKSEILAML